MRVIAVFLFAAISFFTGKKTSDKPAGNNHKVATQQQEYIDEEDGSVWDDYGESNNVGDEHLSTNSHYYTTHAACDRTFAR